MDTAYGQWTIPTNQDGPLGTKVPLHRNVEAPVWDVLSHAMAVATQGTVYVMKGPNANAKTTSTWNRIELPALKANPAVTSIVELSPNAAKLTDGEVIWPASKTPPGSPKVSPRASLTGKSGSRSASPKRLPAKGIHRRHLLQAVCASQGYYLDRCK
ncbi:hypothetical protein MMC11_008915 [Xylographa trunciseda]|nr:hypothetical protein [Xylographa trunciseda]